MRHIWHIDWQCMWWSRWGDRWSRFPPHTHTHIHWKITKYRVSLQYLTGSPEKWQKCQASTQCWPINATPAKHHLMTFRWRADGGPLLVVFGFFLPLSAKTKTNKTSEFDTLWQNFLGLHMQWCVDDKEGFGSRWYVKVEVKIYFQNIHFWRVASYLIQWLLMVCIWQWWFGITSMILQSQVKVLRLSLFGL